MTFTLNHADGVDVFPRFFALQPVYVCCGPVAPDFDAAMVAIGGFMIVNARVFRISFQVILEKKFNIEEVAEFAGVSTATVSRVLNNYPFVKDETRRRVLQVIYSKILCLVMED